MWNEAMMAYFKVISQYLPRWMEGTKKPVRIGSL
jgi:hypothetical protein